MKSLLGIGLIIFSTVSCSSHLNNDYPEKTIGKKEFIDIIVDVQILESHYNNLFQRPNVYANALDSATYFVFEDHEITKVEFENNLKAYASSPDSLYQIYESVLDTINNRKS